MMEKLLTSVGENLKYLGGCIERAAAGAGRDPSEIRLMAVTKTVPPELVNGAISCGVTLLGENRAQELCGKYGAYRKDGVDIHFIGGLQTNKVRQIIDKVSMIQSVDSEKLAQEIARQAQKLGRTMDVLLEVNIGGEESKSGVSPEALEEFVRKLAPIKGIKVQGLMTIPPFSDSDLQNERYFSRMQQLLVDIRGKNIDNINMGILSMGMSGDFELAVKHGSNLVRLGTAIFGNRHP